MIAQNCGDASVRREPGERDPVQAGEESDRQTRLAIRNREEDRTRVGKRGEQVPRKAAIAAIIPVP